MTMKREDFVVGKKYTHESGREFFTCAYSDGNVTVMKCDDGHSFVVARPGEYNPYVEKKRGTVWVNVCIAADGFVFGTSHESRKTADWSTANKRIACIEVPWVEGQGL